MTPQFLSRSLAALSVLLCIGSMPLVGAVPSSAPANLVAPGPSSASRAAKQNSSSAPDSMRQARAALANIPLSFEANRGQTSGRVQWLSRTQGSILFLAGHDAVLEMNTVTPAKTPLDTATTTEAAVRMNLIGASQNTQSEGLQPLPGHANYFHGTNPSQWQRDIPTFARVKMAGVYPGVDLVYYGQNGRLEYDFVVAPGADASAIRFAFDGAKPSLNATGDLLLNVGDHQVTLNRPNVYQTDHGSQQHVNGDFSIAANEEVTFNLGSYDHSRQLTIDPVLIFDGVLGTGSVDAIASGMAVDAAGEIILTGTTRDPAFPTSTGTIQTGCGTSTLSAYIGQPRCPSWTDAFVTKFSADGKSLIFSTYLSGTQYSELGVAVAVDAAGTIYAVGDTQSNDFPITADAYQKLCDPAGINAMPTSPGGGYQYTAIGATCNTAEVPSDDIYLVKINPAGNQLLYGTFLGGSAQDVATGVGLDADNNIYIAGTSSSYLTSYPVSGGAIVFPVTSTAYQTNGSYDNFSGTLSKFTNDGHTLLYSTLMGAPYKTPLGGDHTYGQALAVGANGVAFIGGFTLASEFPTTPGVIKSTCDIVTSSSRPQSCLQNTGFVSAFDTTKSGAASLVYSTMIGPPTGATGVSAHTYVYGLLADASNDVFLTGYTLADNFPTTPGVYQPTCPFDIRNPSCNTAFLSKLNPAGTALLFSTFFNGPDPNYSKTIGQAIATDVKGQVYLYGATFDGYCNMPVLNPIQSTCQGYYQRIFISTFSPDAKQLLFGTEFGSLTGTEMPLFSNGIALDATGNMYFGGVTNNVKFPTTPGTYTTAAPGGAYRSFFGKISPVLAPSATALSITPATTSTGQIVTFTASVTGVSQSTPAATGTVVLTNTNVSPATVIGTITLGALGNGTFTTSALAAGTYKVVASYSSDATYDFSSSAVQTLTINTPVVATATFTTPSTSVKVGSPVTLNITVAGAPGSGTPTGTVFILDGTSSFASVVLTNGTASYTTSALGVGTHTISLNYTGDTTFGPIFSSSQVITVSNYSANVSLLASPVLANPGSSVTLTSTIAAASGTTAPTGKITFLDGTVAIGSGNISSGAATLSTTTLSAGTHTLSASYAGDSLFAAAVSSPIIVNIRAAVATTTVVTSSSLAANPGASVVFTATITSSATTGSPTGAVSFSDGATALGNGTVTNGVATFTTSSLAVGTHQITAVYAGDSLFLGSTSTAITQTIVAPSYTASFTPSTLTITRGQSATASLIVTPIGGFNQTVTFACAGLPASTTCTFSPASLTLNGVSPSSSTLTIATNVATAALAVPDRPGQQENGNRDTFAAGFLGFIGLLAASRRRQKLGLNWTRILGLLLVCITTLTVPLLVGCGGGSPANQTPVGTSNVTVTITSGTTKQTAALTVVIQ